MADKKTPAVPLGAPDPSSPAPTVPAGPKPPAAPPKVEVDPLHVRKTTPKPGEQRQYQTKAANSVHPSGKPWISWVCEQCGQGRNGPAGVREARCICGALHILGE